MSAATPGEATVDAPGHELGDIVITVTIPELGCGDATTSCAPVELPPTGLDAAALPVALAVALMIAGTAVWRARLRLGRTA
ncbi:hypothetical protein [Microbacterium sp. NPDC058389]|uniref:hypothetical protein n=1 Tax=Microbacterium sp. NPDC058389 TaxID=3346475 RepID=UPI0036494437